MNMNTDQRLGTESLPRLMLNLAIPSVIAQLINVLYNIVDRMYIGRIQGSGNLALTGLGVSFPIIMLITAFSAFAGAGGAPLASIQLGKGNKEQAERILGNCTTMLLFFSVILTIVFLIIKEPLLYMFGASEQTIGYANDYISIYLLGTIFVQLSMGLNMFITCQGQAKTAMISVLIGAITNIVLDPILIFGFHMGVKGAAIATITSQAISAIWVVRFLLSKKSIIQIHPQLMKPQIKVIGSIAALGVSPFIMQATESAIAIVLNKGLQTYGGDLYVGSMTILQSVMQLLVIPTQGFTQGVQPIISFNYGAGNYDRVKKAGKIIISFTFAVALVCSLATITFPTLFAQLFTPQKDLIDLVGQVLPIYMAGMTIFGIQLGCQTIFMGLGQAKKSLFIALLRKVILLIPLAIILPKFIGVMGIYYAEPIADTLSALTAGTILLCTIKSILPEKTTTLL